MKILYLYTEVMGYTMSTIKVLLGINVEVHIVHWNHKKLTPYKMPQLHNLHVYCRSDMDAESVTDLAISLDPVVTVVSGWVDPAYLRAAHALRRNGHVVVTGLDGQWYGGFRQSIARFLGKFGYLSRYFSHAWVAGSYQYEYARKLGFARNFIINDLYSADTCLFQKCFDACYSSKQINYPHRFLFVGRFEPVKGLDTLLQAWEYLADRKGDWELCLIGNGSMRQVLHSNPSVIVKDFMQPDSLVAEVEQSGCFILPSRGEPWGVVVHEFASAGLPLIVSDVVGSASTFLVDGLNGYSFASDCHKSLAEKMQIIVESSDSRLNVMSKSSNQLSTRITPRTSAYNLLSIVD